MKPYDLIVMYREKLGLPSDYAAAKSLGMTKAAISIIKSKGTGFNNETAWKIAEALEMDPAEVIAVAEMARAECSDNSDRVSVWKRRLQAVSHSAASVFFGSALLATAVEGVRHCILCQIDYGAGMKARLGF